MPSNDGTGPKGQGPMTGCGMGFCMIATNHKRPSDVIGFAGIDGKPIGISTKNDTTDVILEASAYAEATADNKRR